MQLDGNIGGTIDGTVGGDLQVLRRQVEQAEATGYDGVWSAETAHDPFLPLALAAQQSATLRLGTAVAVAFARNPMTVAVTAGDLHALSRGRFFLGLGSQVRQHVERRFGMPWSEPAERMAEFVLAIKEVWRCWDTGERLSFEGRFYRHTLMTPMFDPGPSAHGRPDVLLAAVGPRMTEVAGRVADGLIAHGFTTSAYLREVTLPAVQAARADAGRTADPFAVCYPGFVVTGRDDAELAEASRAVRKQLAFYASTPAYRSVLEHHGWGALQGELQVLSREGRWDDMADLVGPELLAAFAVVGSPEEVGAEVHRRFAGLVDRFTVFAPYSLAPEVARQVVAAVRARARSAAEEPDRRGRAVDRPEQSVTDDPGPPRTEGR